MRYLLILSYLLIASCFASAASAKTDLTSIPTNTFIKGKPVPGWAMPLSDLPPSTHTDPVVVRLAETKVELAGTPTTLLNRAIQVNDRSRLNEIGQFSIEYYPVYQKLNLHRVAIVRNGQILERTATVRPRLLQRETAMESGMYGGATTVQLLLDDVRVGDTLWVTYSTEGLNPVFGKVWADTFSWDGANPVELRRLSVMYPKERQVQWRLLGDFRRDAIAPQIDEINGQRRVRFEGHDLARVEFEPDIPPDYLPTQLIQFSEYGDWHSVATWAASLFPRVKSGPALAALAREFSKEPTSEAKVTAALHWVQREIRYFSVSIGENSHRPQAPDVVLGHRYGDCKDKSYLLVTLLGQMGIDARPVLLDSRSDKVPARLLASPDWFDHVIVRVTLADKDYFVDPTRESQVAPLEKLPLSFPGARGLVIDTNTVGLTELPQAPAAEPDYEHSERMIVEDVDGDVELETTEIYRGDYADWARVRFSDSAPETHRKTMLALYEKTYPGVTLKADPTWSDDASTNTVRMVASYTLPKPLVHEDKRYKIDFDSQVMSGTLGIPDKLVRNFPLALPRGKYWGRYRLRLEWPKNFDANDAPISKTVESPFFRVAENYINRGNLLDYLMDYQIKTDVVPAKDVPSLQTESKKLEEFVSGHFFVKDDIVLPKDGMKLNVRQRASGGDGQWLMDKAREMQKVKQPTPENIFDACTVALVMLDYADIAKRSTEWTPERFIAVLSSERDAAIQPAIAQCVARMAFAQGDYKRSAAQFEAKGPLPNGSGLLLDLAWAQYYSGDTERALATLDRYRSDTYKSPDDFEVSSLPGQIALWQRAGKALPADVDAYARALPDGPWPRPLLAMQVGAITTDELLKSVDTLPESTRERVLDDAWYYIGQRDLVLGLPLQAKKAFRWYKPYGIRRVHPYLQASVELDRLMKTDVPYEDGLKAYDSKNYALALASWQRSQAPAAQFELGNMYYRGIGVQQDFAQALHWFGLAADQQDDDAENMLGIMYAEGDGVQKDETAALAWYQKAAEQYNAAALNNLSYRYRDGTVVPQDRKRSLSLLNAAAEAGHLDAQTALGLAYVNGAGVPVDYKLAFYWDTRAAALGDPAGMEQLGYLYDRGYGVRKDPERAFRLYRASAEAGNAIGQYDLALDYALGEGTPKNSALAVTWMEKAVDKGNIEAMLELSRWYRQGENVSQNAAKSVEILTKAADSGSAEAQRLLAYRYEQGEGVARELSIAFKLFRQAADQGDLSASARVGQMLQFGVGVPANAHDAVPWYEKAANGGNALAQNNLADMYENGNGVEQDYVRAVELYRKAAAQGKAISFVSLAEMHYAGRFLPHDVMLAYVYYKLGEAVNDEQTVAHRAASAAQLTTAQRQRAESIASNWKAGMPLPDASVTAN